MESIILCILVQLPRISWPCKFPAGSYFSLLVWLGGGGCLVKECKSSLEFIVWCSQGKWNYRSQEAWGGGWAIARPALTPITFYEGESKHQGGWNQVSALLNLLPYIMTENGGKASLSLSGWVERKTKVMEICQGIWTQLVVRVGGDIRRHHLCSKYSMSRYLIT